MFSTEHLAFGGRMILFALISAKALMAETHPELAQELAEMVRKDQEAFHPNATQFTLQLGDHLFGFWRQSISRRQSIFCISNVTDQTHQVSLSDINLTVTDDWVDLITGDAIEPSEQFIQLEPYQTVWLTNKPHKQEHPS